MTGACRLVRFRRIKLHSCVYCLLLRLDKRAFIELLADFGKRQQKIRQRDICLCLYIIL